MKKSESTLHMKMPAPLKKQVKRAAEKQSLTMTQWVNKVIREVLNV